MRLTQTAYLFGEYGELIGYDDWDRPVYGDPLPEIPFLMELEPFIPELAKTQYGIFVEVRYRMFTEPNESLNLNTEFVFNGQRLKITEVLKYKRHFECMVNVVGNYP
ncbi:hypothetical protein [Bacillus litorisediminis]|uniref:hypothetical protein n=1 Tax=Bacillus litorisediminis TaxID=2922713 RepID=UPI001FAED2A5|nr:hypothetical protein [Bacillus litorisediminis]